MDDNQKKFTYNPSQINEKEKNNISSSNNMSNIIGFANQQNQANQQGQSQEMLNVIPNIKDNTSNFKPNFERLQVEQPEEDVPTFNPQMNILQQANSNQLNVVGNLQDNMEPSFLNQNNNLAGIDNIKEDSSNISDGNNQLNVVSDNINPQMNILQQANNNQLNVGFNNKINQDMEIKDDQIQVNDNNRFINSSFDTSSTMLNDLNNSGENDDGPRVDYSVDPKVLNNIKEDEKRKKTITITEEAKMFLIIIGVLLVFIFVMPYIFDAIRNLGR